MSTTGNIKIRLAETTMKYNFFDTKLYGFSLIIIINKISGGRSDKVVFEFACALHFHAINVLCFVIYVYCMCVYKIWSPNFFFFFLFQSLFVLLYVKCIIREAKILRTKKVGLCFCIDYSYTS